MSEAQTESSAPRHVRGESPIAPFWPEMCREVIRPKLLALVKAHEPGSVRELHNRFLETYYAKANGCSLQWFSQVVEDCGLRFKMEVVASDDSGDDAPELWNE